MSRRKKHHTKEEHMHMLHHHQEPIQEQLGEGFFPKNSQYSRETARETVGGATAIAAEQNQISQEQPKTQRIVRREQRGSTTGATRQNQNIAESNGTTPAEVTKKIVMDAVIELIPQILNNFIAIICKVIVAHGITAEDKHQHINEGILKVMESFVNKYQQPERKRTSAEANLLDLSSESDMEDDGIINKTVDEIRKGWMKVQ